MGIAVHAATGTRPVPGLRRRDGRSDAGLTRPASRSPRELTIAGTPAQVTSQLALYLEAGAPLAAVICDPVPSAESRELLAYVRCLLNQP